uniref:Uncharacterized protein n=1 Tax=Anopheles quadriannulatus TaxID=34691 RepID=A0A182XDJ9_ANOQN
MERLRPEDPKAVMPYAKRLLQLSGFRQDTEQLGTRIYLNLCIFVAAILVPKVCFPYPDTEAMIRGFSELIFFTNIFVGLFCFIAQHRHYRELLNAIESFVNIVYRTSSQQPESLSERNLIKLNVKINQISVVYCYYVAVAAFAYWIAPCVITYLSIHKEQDIAGNGTMHAIQYYPNLEESFYWLDNRTSVRGYAVLSVVAFITFIFAVYSQTTKLLTILSTIKYCSTLLQLVNIGIDELDVTSMMSLLIMINLTPEMFGYCFFCSDLATTGTTISRQMYEFQWERHRPVVQKMVAMVIARGQARLRITAWGIIPIDLELFAKVVKASYTVLLVLKDFI